MSLERILAALIVRVQSVEGLGHLYPYDRVMVPPEDVEAVFGIEDATAARGWSIRSGQWSRQGVTEERLDLSSTIVSATHHLRFRVYEEHNDQWQSEVAFRRRLDALRGQLRYGEAIAPEATIVTAPQMENDGAETLVILGDTYLCHQAIITLDAQEVVYWQDDGTWKNAAEIEAGIAVIVEA